MTRSRGSCLEDLGLGRGAEDDLARTAVEPADRRLDVADAAADPAGRSASRSSISAALLPRAHGRVEVDHGDLAGQAEALGDRPRVAGVERLRRAADELDRLAALQVDGGDDHGRTRMPCSCR